MTTTPRPDPFKNFRFKVEISGEILGYFTECSGLSSKVSVIEFRQGGDPKTVFKLPGQTSYTDITLKWGLTTSRDLYDWHKMAFEGNVERKGGAVIIFDDAGNVAARWEFKEAWPSQWTGPALNAKSNEVAIETLVLTCESVERSV